MESLTIAKIDLAALAHNIKLLQQFNNSSCMMAVVKADGYGHGAIAVARTALDTGADRLAVARLSEAVSLRNAGITAPILLFGYSPPSTIKDLLEYNVTATVNSLESAKSLSDCLQKQDKTLRIHVKVDTGMGRLGLAAVTGDLEDTSAIKENLKQTTKDVLAIARMPGVEIEGIFTHFANADSPRKQHAEQQFYIFTDLLNMIKRKGLEVGIRHAANSAATISMPQTHLDMVRPGIAMYGLWPSNKVNHPSVDLKPAMTLSSRVIQVKKIEPGFKVSYGSTYKTNRSTTIATIALGYADGLNRLLSSKGYLLIHGQRCSIIGRVCMDLIMVDTSLVPNTAVGDEAIVIGKQGNESIHAEEVASLINTINYEIVTSITHRVKRIYSKGYTDKYGSSLKRCS